VGVALPDSTSGLGGSILVTDNEPGFAINLRQDLSTNAGVAAISDTDGMNYSIVDSGAKDDGCPTAGSPPPGVLTITAGPGDLTVTAPAEVQLSASVSMQGAQFYWMDNGQLFSIDQNPTLAISGPGIHVVTVEAAANGQIVLASMTIMAQQGPGIG
jgi:hypothetical protein